MTLHRYGGAGIKEGIGMRDWLYRFMQGRYGMDQMGKFTSIASMVLVILSIVLSRWYTAGMILNTAGFAGIVYSWFRMLSRNYAKRTEENRAYQNYASKVRRFFGRQKYMMNERKTNHIYSCPGCGQKIRIPRGKGKIEIRCPKCGTAFVRKS